MKLPNTTLMISMRPFQRISEKTVLLSVLNRSRNQAKHANDPNETHVGLDHTEPLQMIMRALPMAQNLTSSMSQYKAELDV